VKGMQWEGQYLCSRTARCQLLTECHLEKHPVER
jgi:hypothetical protein